MTWLIVTLSYLLGSIPTAYIAARRLKCRDIRELGDGNSGAANAFRELGAGVGILVGLIDAFKGVLAIVIARLANITELGVLAAGLAVVIGHNWPVFLGFHGGRGVSTTIGVLTTLLPVPMIIVSVPAIIVLFLSHGNVILASVVLFPPLLLVSWWLGVPGILILYSLLLMCLLGLTHLLRVKPRLREA